MSKNKAKEVSTKSPAGRGRLASVPTLDADMGRFFDRRWPGLFDWSRLSELSEIKSPHVDVLERESDIVVKAEMPGFKKEEIDVSVTDNTITIKAATKSESEKEQDGDYYVKEISRGYVSRTLRLPSDVNGDEAKAKHSNGMLKVTIPKVAKAKRQRIEVES